MILNLIALILTGAAAYYGYTKVVADKLDTPQNNQAVKGLEKQEIKAAIKEGETKQKEVKEEIKKLESERQEILKGSDADKGDKAKEKMEAKEAKLQELKEIETNLADLKVVDKGGWKAKLPNKISWNNGLWIGGLLIALVVIYKVCIAIFRSIFQGFGWNE